MISVSWLRQIWPGNGSDPRPLRRGPRSPVAGAAEAGAHDDCQDPLGDLRRAVQRGAGRFLPA